MNEVIEKLTKYLRTRSNMDNFVSRINAVLLQFSEYEITVLESYLTLTEIQIISVAVKSMDDLKQLREHLARVEIFTIQISFPLSAYFEQQIVDKILEATKEPCVVQILPVKQLLAGAVLDYKGRYRDYSLKLAIEEWRKKKAIHV